MGCTYFLLFNFSRNLLYFFNFFIIFKFGRYVLGLFFFNFGKGVLHFLKSWLECTLFLLKFRLGLTLFIGDTLNRSKKSTVVILKTKNNSFLFQNFGTTARTIFRCVGIALPELIDAVIIWIHPRKRISARVQILFLYWCCLFFPFLESINVQLLKTGHVYTLNGKSVMVGVEGRRNKGWRE